jgi:hypothetical protein
MKGYHPLRKKGLRFGELIIENVPCLERLLQLIVGLDTSVISTPRLETLGFLSSGYCTRLVLDSTVVQVAMTFLPAFLCANELHIICTYRWPNAVFHVHEGIEC